MDLTLRTAILPLFPRVTALKQLVRIFFPTSSPAPGMVSLSRIAIPASALDILYSKGRDRGSVMGGRWWEGYARERS